MLGYQFGPRTQRIYLALHERILGGTFPPDSQLPPHTRLATEYGVAPLTIRQVLARLSDEGLIDHRLPRRPRRAARDAGVPGADPG